MFIALVACKPEIFPPFKAVINNADCRRLLRSWVASHPCWSIQRSESRTVDLGVGADLPVLCFSHQNIYSTSLSPDVHNVKPAIHLYLQRHWRPDLSPFHRLFFRRLLPVQPARARLERVQTRQMHQRCAFLHHHYLVQCFSQFCPTSSSATYHLQASTVKAKKNSAWSSICARW